MKEIQVRLRSGGGVIHRRDHRDLTGTIDRLLRTGQLTALLPAVYSATPEAEQPDVRLRAAALWAGPDAVLTGRSAARLTYWPGCRSEVVTLALPTQSKRSVPGVQVECRAIPPWLTRRVGPLTVTSPALTAVDLAGGAEQGNAIDEALRTGAATLEEMWDAFRAQPYRRGNVRRAVLLDESRDRPWSPAERLQHQLLRAASIKGWKGNRSAVAGSARYVVAVLFERERLILEIDGWETHGSREAFEADRRRGNALVLAGYRILHFTWRHLVDDPEWVISTIRTALGR